MAKRIYKYINNKFVECGISSIYERQPDAPSVISDTLTKPLRHPVTSKIHDSKSEYMKETRSLGLEVVGNDLLSRKARNIPDVVTEEKIQDALQRAEAIHNDPTKRRDMENRNNYLYEQHRRLLNEK